MSDAGLKDFGLKDFGLKGSGLKDSGLKDSGLKDSAAPLAQAAKGLWQQVQHYAHTEPLLQIALIAMALIIAGGALRRILPLPAGLLRFVGNIGLIYAMLATMLQVAHDSGFGTPLDAVGSGAGEGEPSVSGGETRVPMNADGHFWVRASVNGVPHRFLVDTGATLTTLSPDSANASAVRPQRWGQTVELNTANGSSTGTLATIDRMQVGNIVARHIDAVVAPGLGETNVLGMNFLSRLSGWRVEGRQMILVPHHPVVEASGKAREE